MPNVFKVIQIKIGKGYEIQLIKDGETIWLRLSESDVTSVIGIWSTREAQTHVSYEEVVTQLSALLYGISVDSKQNYDVLKFWPKGWDFWGAAIPKPISDYLIWGEFFNQLEQLKLIEKTSTLMENLTGEPDNKAYYQALFDLFIALNPPRTKEYGLGCIMVLEYSTISFNDGRIISSDDQTINTINNIVNAIAIVFSSVNSDNEWWKTEYEKEALKSSISAIAKSIIISLKKAPLVKEIKTYLP